MTSFTIIAAALLPHAWAQDAEEDDDLLGTKEDTVKEEQEAVKSGDLDDRAGAKGDGTVESTLELGPIKVMPRKTFLKIGRFEAMPHVGFVTNDPFLNRYIGGVRVAYHVTEVFAIEGTAAYAPDLGDADWKQLTHQLVEENNVSPDISKMLVISDVAFQYSPIYGKVALNGENIINFDIYGAFGMGVVQTKDDLEALQATDSPTAIATQVQWHPTTTFGGGARVAFNQTVAVRIEGRSLVYIETVDSHTLEMKNNFILAGGVSFFFPQADL